MTAKPPRILYAAAAAVIGFVSGVITPCLAFAAVPAIAAFSVYAESRSRLADYRFRDALVNAALPAGLAAAGLLLGGLLMPLLMTVPMAIMALSHDVLWGDILQVAISTVSAALIYAVVAGLLTTCVACLGGTATLGILKARARRGISDAEHPPAA